MDPDADLAAIASLMADRHRAQMLLALLGGTPQSGSALAEAAGVSRSLASAHLKKLVAGGLVRAEPSGRQRLYSIASEPVADALEILTLLAPATPVRSLRDSVRARSLRWARMCYDHLAGAVGVAVAGALVGGDLIREHDGGYVLAPRGAAGFGEFGIDVGELRYRSRPLLRPCMDWSEHRHHLAGSLGAAIAAEMVRRDWLHTREATRIVTVTESGEAGLRDWLGVDVSQLRTAA
ncbi:MAG: winged helix-turn-helix transcriptional regulator [Streptosporangiaceae bacterium]|nr:winged helix-turn-helix transcriptional regulator [Streptosporangiaceae bacterium]MBV9857504.1 winged helix-turn-helix transcriptional regulator [Streptosporangiaceae bacterium]